MLRYLFSRLLRAILTIAAVVTFAFVVLRLSGDPALLIMSVDAPPEAVEAFRAAWGLDRPVWEQHLRYFVQVAQVNLGWLPSGGAESWRHAILPVITLGLSGAAILARFTRSAMLEVLGQPYIRAASAKGLPWRRVVTDHALPNAAIPTVTIIGFMVGSLVAGAVVVESVFSWPGVGRLLVVAVSNRDLAIVQTILLLVAMTMVCANLIVDMLYGWIDPRLRTARAAGG